MIYRGHVQNGVVILEEGAKLPDGAVVDVQPIEVAPRTTLAERFKNIILDRTQLNDSRHWRYDCGRYTES